MPGPSSDAYPLSAADRDRWILARRAGRPDHDAHRPQGVFLERERDAAGEVVSVLTVLLTSRECPWRCLMCDLWQGTVPGPVPAGAVPAQLRDAFAQVDKAAVRPRQIKLYNSGSFFDPLAVPPADYGSIAAEVAGFERVIVECHPALMGRRAFEFREALQGCREQAGGAGGVQLEVAMGLETANPEVLARLNKRMTLDGFRRAADFLRRHGLALRAFILVQPPYQDEATAGAWACRSIDFAFDCGATVAVLIPTRSGNGAVDALGAAGVYTRPRLATLEAALDHGLRQRRGRVFADLWGLERFAACTACFPERRARLEQANWWQTLPARRPCAVCGE